MSFRVVGTNHTSFTVSSLDRTLPFFLECLGFKLVSRAPAAINTGPNRGRKVVYCRDGDGVTFEFIEVKT